MSTYDKSYQPLGSVSLFSLSPSTRLAPSIIEVELVFHLEDEDSLASPGFF